MRAPPEGRNRGGDPRKLRARGNVGRLGARTEGGWVTLGEVDFVKRL